eukprot:15345242-Ditylum_brightwellii.AAC.1
MVLSIYLCLLEHSTHEMEAHNATLHSTHSSYNITKTNLLARIMAAYTHKDHLNLQDHHSFNRPL